MDLLFHYTTGDTLRRILENKALIPDKTEPENQKEIPTVTFSSNPEWERTRYRVGRLPDDRLILMDKDLLEKHCGGLYRIAVPASLAPLDWHGIKEHVHMSQNAIQAIYDLHKRVGARTSEWFASTETIPEAQWISIETLREGVWTPLAADELPEPLAAEVPDQPKSRSSASCEAHVR